MKPRLVRHPHAAAGVMSVVAAAALCVVANGKQNRSTSRLKAFRLAFFEPGVFTIGCSKPHSCLLFWQTQSISPHYCRGPQSGTTGEQEIQDRYRISPKRISASETKWSGPQTGGALPGESLESAIPEAGLLHRAAPRRDQPQRGGPQTGETRRS
jgi:hypothetical protein